MAETALSSTVPLPEVSSNFVCPECGLEFEKPIRLGLHRRNVHNVEGKWSKGNRKARRRPARPVIDTLKDMADEAGAGKSKSVPNSEQLTRAFSRGLTTVGGAAAIWAVETDPRPLSDAHKEQAIDYLALRPAAAHEICEPLGRAFASSPLNKRYGRAVVDNVDVVSSMCELTIIMMHWRNYMRDRSEWSKSHRGGTGGAYPSTPEPEQPYDESSQTSNGTPLGQREGVVWTPEHVKAMQRG